MAPYASKLNVLNGELVYAHVCGHPSVGDEHCGYALQMHNLSTVIARAKSMVILNLQSITMQVVGQTSFFARLLASTCFWFRGYILGLAR